jgi:hypothetical protein
MKALLLVTWIVTGQPPNSYQTPFDTMDLCLAARATVVVEADRLNTETDQKVAQIGEQIRQMYNQLVNASIPPDRALDTAQRYYQMYLPPRQQSKVSAVCVAQ